MNIYKTSRSIEKTKETEKGDTYSDSTESEDEGNSNSEKNTHLEVWNEKTNQKHDFSLQNEENHHRFTFSVDWNINTSSFVESNKMNNDISNCAPAIFKVQGYRNPDVILLDEQYQRIDISKATPCLIYVEVNNPTGYTLGIRLRNSDSRDKTQSAIEKAVNLHCHITDKGVLKEGSFLTVVSPHTYTPPRVVFDGSPLIKSGLIESLTSQSPEQVILDSVRKLKATKHYLVKADSVFMLFVCRLGVFQVKDGVYDYKKDATGCVSLDSKTFNQAKSELFKFYNSFIPILDLKKLSFDLVLLSGKDREDFKKSKEYNIMVTFTFVLAFQYLSTK